MPECPWCCGGVSAANIVAIRSPSPVGAGDRITSPAWAFWNADGIVTVSGGLEVSWQTSCCAAADAASASEMSSG